MTDLPLVMDEDLGKDLISYLNQTFKTRKADPETLSAVAAAAARFLSERGVAVPHASLAFDRTTGRLLLCDNSELPTLTEPKRRYPVCIVRWIIVPIPYLIPYLKEPSAQPLGDEQETPIGVPSVRDPDEAVRSGLGGGRG